jgi:hypothetical protein
MWNVVSLSLSLSLCQSEASQAYSAEQVWSFKNCRESLPNTYCGMQTRCWAMTAKKAAIQQPLLSDGFANKHVYIGTIAQQYWNGIFSAFHAKML